MRFIERSTALLFFVIVATSGCVSPDTDTTDVSDGGHGRADMGALDGGDRVDGGRVGDTNLADSSEQPPCLELQGSSVVEFEGRAGSSVRQTVALISCDDEAIEVTGVRACDAGSASCEPSAFEVVEVRPTLVQDRATILPGEELWTAVALDSSTEGSFLGTLEVHLRGVDTPIRVDLAGEIVVACPEIASVLPNDRVQPTDLVELKAETFEPAGRVDRYRWVLAGRPTTSCATIPDPSVPELSFRTDVAGDYLIGLEALDDQGSVLCSDREPISAVPAAGLWLELSWTTPADPDPTDDVGADLDLHVLHAANGDWAEQPWSVWPKGLTEGEWGAPGPADNPSLLAGDGVGCAPEVFELPEVIPGTRYDVGVHLFDDAGFGQSVATLRLYEDGVMTGTWSETLTSQQPFWWAAFYDKAIGPTAVNQLLSDFP